jgi:hypothetical protein
MLIPLRKIERIGRRDLHSSLPARSSQFAHQDRDYWDVVLGVLHPCGSTGIAKTPEQDAGILPGA